MTLINVNKCLSTPLVRTCRAVWKRLCPRGPEVLILKQGFMKKRNRNSERTQYFSLAEIGNSSQNPFSLIPGNVCQFCKLYYITTNIQYAFQKGILWQQILNHMPCQILSYSIYLSFTKNRKTFTWRIKSVPVFLLFV